MVQTRGIKRADFPKPRQTRKKSRKEADCAELFLEAIPEEVVGNVLKFLSLSPHAENWVSQIPLRYFWELFGVRTELGRGLKARFTTLYISRSFDFLSNHNTNKWNLRPEGMAWTDDIKVAREFVLAGGDQSIKTLIIGDGGMYNKRWHGVKIVSDFLKNCPNVTHLSTTESDGVWATKFGGQIEYLEMRCKSRGLFAVQRHCTKLREAKIHSRPSVRWIKSDAALCDGSARTLECLNLNFGLSIPQIEKIQESCRALKRLFLRGDHDALSKLFASYGSQLEWAYL